MAFSTRTRRLATLLPVAAFSISGTQAFSPVFSNPKQCGALTVSWSSFETPESAFGTPSISVSLIPLESAAHHAQEPYTIDVPCHENGGEYTIPSLPFPFGTQFFASAHVPAAAGPIRRRVSSILTVSDSNDSSCLPKQVPTGRYAKSFGRRQIQEVGVGTIGTDQASSTAPPATNSGPVPPIRVIGESSIPASGRIETPGNVAPAPEQANSAPVPPIREVGVGQQPVVGEPVDDDAVIDENAPTTTFFAPEPAYTDVNQGEENDNYGSPYPYDQAAHESIDTDVSQEEENDNHGSPYPYDQAAHEPVYTDVNTEEGNDYHGSPYPYDHVAPEESRPEDVHHEVLPGASFEYPEPAPWAVEFYQEGRVWDYEYVRDTEESPVEVMPEAQDPHYPGYY